MDVRAGRLVVALCLVAASGCGAAARRPGGPSADPGAVALEGAADNRFVPAGETAEVVARLRVAAVTPPSLARPPLNIALVLDTSGSMEGQPIADARGAALALVDSLSRGDRIAVVTFGSRHEVLVPSTVVSGRSLAAIRQSIEATEASGTTDLAGGLQAGIQQVLENQRSDVVSRVVLLSDGVPNDATSIEAFAQAAGERGVAIVALGLGVEYDESLLGRIAQLSGGRFHYIEGSELVASVFRDEVLRLQRVVARGTSLSLRAGPGVTIDSVVGQPIAGQVPQVTVSVGDLVEGETREYVVHMTVSGRRDGAAVELLDASLAFSDALGGAGALERSLFLGLRATADAETLSSGRNPEVAAAAARLEAAAATVEAIRVARSGELDEARRILDESVAAARDRAEELDDEDLAARAESMDELGEALPSVSPAAAPGGAPAEAPARVRRAHADAMDALLSQ